MKPKIALARAISGNIASRALNIAGLIALAAALILFTITALLAYNFSPWWWLLLIPIMALAGLAVAIYITVRMIISAIYPTSITKAQRQQVKDFTDKVTGLLEARTTPLPMYAAITVADLIRYREPRTVQKIITDSKGLKDDYLKLEQEFITSDQLKSQATSLIT